MQARRLKTAAVIAAATALAVGLAGCAQSKRDTTTAGGGGTFIFAGAGDPNTFDPIFDDDGESLRVIRQIYDTLIQNKPGTAELQPALASSWDHDPSGKVWTFHLRQGVKFADGTDFNAAAVCFNFDRWFNMKGAAAQSVMAYYSDVFEGFAQNESKDLGDPVYHDCKASDPSTAVITLNKYKGAFPGAFTLASFAISSPTALQKYNADQVTQSGDAFSYSDYANKNPTGTGSVQVRRVGQGHQPDHPRAQRQTTGARRPSWTRRSSRSSRTPTRANRSCGPVRSGRDRLPDPGGHQGAGRCRLPGPDPSRRSTFSTWA